MVFAMRSIRHHLLLARRDVMSTSPSNNAQTVDHAIPVIDVQDLHVHFAQETGTLHAVRGLSFKLYAGESLAIVGESGSGKSATAMAIMGLQWL